MRRRVGNKAMEIKVTSGPDNENDYSLMAEWSDPPSHKFSWSKLRWVKHSEEKHSGRIIGSGGHYRWAPSGFEVPHDVYNMCTRAVWRYQKGFSG